MQECKTCQGAGWLFPWQMNSSSTASYGRQCPHCAGSGLVPDLVIGPFDSNDQGWQEITINTLKEGDLVKLSWYRARPDMPVNNVKRQFHQQWVQVITVKRVNITVGWFAGPGDPVIFSTTITGIDQVVRFEDPQVALEHIIDKAAGHHQKVKQAGLAAEIEVTQAIDLARAKLLTALRVDNMTPAQHYLVIKIIENIGPLVRDRYTGTTVRFLLGDPIALRPGN